MQRAVGAETEAILGERDVAGIIPVEIFAQNFFRALADAAAQRFADVDAFSRDPKSHVDASIGLPLCLSMILSENRYPLFPDHAPGRTEPIAIWGECNQAGAV